MHRLLVVLAAAALTACNGAPWQAASGDGARSGEVDVPFGTELPFGQIARVCGVNGRNLGGTAEDTNVRGYAIHDSAPDIISKRTFYVTGFSDGCPRQFTAATAVWSIPSRYEEFRYGPAGANLPYGATDEAYDRLKRAACGVGKRRPCGTRLDRSAFFISAYEFYGNNARWASILIHGDTVLAATIKTAR